MFPVRSKLEFPRSHFIINCTYLLIYVPDCIIGRENKGLEWQGFLFFIIIANRDEYHERPTTKMHWWSNNQILAGKDEEAGGTW